MHPSFLLAELHAEQSLPRLALSALPGAPVQPHTTRPRRHHLVTSWRSGRRSALSPLLRLRRVATS